MTNTEKQLLQIKINEAEAVVSGLQQKLSKIKQDEKDNYLGDIKKNFMLKSSHIKLLKRMEFEGIFYGDLVSIGVDGKRPFGNSHTYGDIAEILGWKKPNDDLSDEQQIEAERLMHELPLAVNEVIKALTSSSLDTLTLKNKDI